MFTGFSAEQERLISMLTTTAGLSGARDQLTRFTTPISGSSAS
jgi:hypothetical protein